jgi:hypothetical protein
MITEYDGFKIGDLVEYKIHPDIKGKIHDYEMVVIGFVYCGNGLYLVK